MVDRFRFERADVEQFLDETRAAGMPRPETGDEITMGVSQYSQNLLDHRTDELRPFTMDSLIDATKIVDAFHDRGVRAGAPGTPMDVHPDLQPVAIFWTSLSYSRSGGVAPDPRSAASHRYVMDMAECAGRPIRLLPVYVSSPLTLSGISLDAVLAFRERIDAAWVLSMPCAGVSVPVRPGDAFAVATAEVVGSAMLVREMTGLDVGWEIQMFPADLRYATMAFGSPENLLLHLGAAEVNAYLHGADWWRAPHNIHTMSKAPDAQAAAEKAGIMMAGALLGGREFAHAGTLSLDEVFSPEQLAVDCEIRDHVARAVSGLDTDCDAERAVASTREALSEGFLSLDETLDEFRSHYWHPSVFSRELLASWTQAGARDLRAKAREAVEQALGAREFALEETLQREIDGIYARAKEEFSS